MSNSGIVIKATPFKDKSYVLTILTEEGLVSGYYHEKHGLVYKELFSNIIFTKNKTEIIPEGFICVYDNIKSSLTLIDASLLILTVLNKIDEKFNDVGKEIYRFIDYILSQLKLNNLYNLLFLFLTKMLYFFGFNYLSFTDHNFFYLVKTFYKENYKTYQFPLVSKDNLAKLLTFYFENGIINNQQIKNLLNRL